MYILLSTVVQVTLLPAPSRATGPTLFCEVVAYSGKWMAVAFQRLPWPSWSHASINCNYSLSYGQYTQAPKYTNMSISRSMQVGQRSSRVKAKSLRLATGCSLISSAILAILKVDNKSNMYYDLQFDNCNQAWDYGLRLRGHTAMSLLKAIKGTQAGTKRESYRHPLRQSLPLVGVNCPLQ